jgi:hypothetical protein
MFSNAPPLSSPAVTPGLADALELLVVLIFLVLALHKEVVSGRPAGWAEALDGALNIALVPLGLAAMLIIGSRIFKFLS